MPSNKLYMTLRGTHIILEIPKSIISMALNKLQWIKVLGFVPITFSQTSHCRVGFGAVAMVDAKFSFNFFLDAKFALTILLLFRYFSSNYWEAIDVGFAVDSIEIASMIKTMMIK